MYLDLEKRGWKDEVELSSTGKFEGKLHDDCKGDLEDDREEVREEFELERLRHHVPSSVTAKVVD